MKYFRNTSWMFTEQMLRMGAGLLVSLWVARYLGPARFGVFSYILAFSAIFAGVAKLGLDGIVIRELINHPEQTANYLGTAFWLKVLGALLALVMVMIATGYATEDTTSRLFIVIITAGIIFQSFEVIDFYFQAQVLAKFVSICRIIQTVLSSLVKIYLVLTQSELLGFVLVSVFDQITLGLSLFIAYRAQKLPNFYKAFDLKIAKNLLKDSWPLMFSALVTMIYMRIDQLMIKEMLGEYQAGIYAAAVRLSEVWYFIPTLITTSLFPAIISAKRDNLKLYRQRLQKLYVLLVWTALAVAVLISFFSDRLVSLLYGPAYAGADKILLINAWTGVFVSLFIVSGRWILAENLTHHSLLRNSLAVLVNVAMNLILIKKYGAAGAALASMLAFASAGLFYDIFFPETRAVLRMKLRAFFPFMIKQV